MSVFCPAHVSLLSTLKFLLPCFRGLYSRRKEIVSFLMPRKRIPEVLVILLAILLIALVMTVFDKKMKKLNNNNVDTINESSNQKKP